MLARGLLGPAPVLESGALAFEPIFWGERGAGIDPRKWSVGCFRTRDQLLPIFLIHISAALHSNLQGEVNRLKRRNDGLQSQLESQSSPLDKAREALRSQQRRARRKAQIVLNGHKRVQITDIPQPKTTLHSIDFDSNAEIELHEKQRMEEANGPGTARWTRGKGTPGVIGLESVIVKLPGA